eukprot:TRINITY_DN4578_c0_g1_i1.p1 TRINITY_DN4578_c0_g1~~TRINITY_DN4578_c0_g1_i1.p1  ORF type:complete len:394 (-),score=77.46 TRINITY_DN4578_c0_g1_i1:32-1213(-)
MMDHYQESITNLYFLSHVKKGTKIHLGSNNMFKITASAISSVPFGQSMFNWVKGRDSNVVFVDPLRNFTQEVIALIEQDVERMATLDNPHEVKSLFFIVSHMVKLISLAIHGFNGDDKAGLICMPTVYTGERDEITEINREFENTTWQLLSRANDLLPEKFHEEVLRMYIRRKTVGFSLESSFSDADWENLVRFDKSYGVEPVSLKRSALEYQGGLLFNRGMNTVNDGWHWWDAIEEFHGATLFLGALPIKSDERNDAKFLSECEIKAVLSLVLAFEIQEGDGFSPVSKEDWADFGVTQLHVPTQDFKTLGYDSIQRGVEFIHWNISNGRSTYVHCKAGRGRSALIVMCYLVKYHQMTAEDAYITVKSERQQVFEKTDPKWQTLVDYSVLYST